jgi:hypothetical protein
MFLTGTYAVCNPPPKPKQFVPEALLAVYAEVQAQAVELWRQGKTHISYRTRTGKPWRNPQQIIKLLRSFDGTQQAQPP